MWPQPQPSSFRTCDLQDNDMDIKLRTEVSTAPHRGILDHDREILLLGSCFSDNVGRRLAERGYRVTANPLGPVYNPLSLLAQARLIASGRTLQPSEMFEHQGLWRHFMSHTLLAAPTSEAAAEAINCKLTEARSRLTADTLLCITLGTAWVFELAVDTGGMKAGEVVANCHKLPSQLFSRRLISPDEAYAATAEAVRLLSPADTIVTVSPIRHLADGLDGNSLSKATLRLAAHRLTADGAIYFPAFEALTDDLRDYRFYNPDMIHPTEQAADYVYLLFEDTFATEQTRRHSAGCLKASRRAAHRPLFKHTLQ